MNRITCEFIHTWEPRELRELRVSAGKRRRVHTDLFHFPLELLIGLLRLRHLPPGGRKLFLYFANLSGHTAKGRGTTRGPSESVSVKCTQSRRVIHRLVNARFFKSFPDHE